MRKPTPRLETGAQKFCRSFSNKLYRLTEPGRSENSDGGWTFWKKSHS